MQNTPSFQISITLFDPTVEWRRIVILCISVLLVKLLYLDYWIWPFWTIYVLLPCQFIKSNLSLSTPNPNKCQKYICDKRDKRDKYVEILMTYSFQI